MIEHATACSMNEYSVPLHLLRAVSIICEAAFIHHSFEQGTENEFCLVQKNVSLFPAYLQVFAKKQTKFQGRWDIYERKRKCVIQC